MNYFSHLPLEWLGIILILVGALLFMISFGCNHAEDNIIDDNSRTPWKWVDRLEARFAIVLNPVRSFLETGGLIVVISGLAIFIIWFIRFLSTRS